MQASFSWVGVSRLAFGTVVSISFFACFVLVLAFVHVAVKNERLLFRVLLFLLLVVVVVMAILDREVDYRRVCLASCPVSSRLAIVVFVFRLLLAIVLGFSSCT